MKSGADTEQTTHQTLTSLCAVRLTLQSVTFLQYVKYVSVSFYNVTEQQQPYRFTLTYNRLHKSVHLFLLTPYLLHGAVLLETLTGLQLLKKFPAFCGTRRSITALTSVLNMSLSWASPIQSKYPHPTSWRSILI